MYGICEECAKRDTCKKSIGFMFGYCETDYEPESGLFIFETVQPSERDWTPAQLIYEWAKENSIKSKNGLFFERLYKIGSDWYQYKRYRILSDDCEKCKVAVYLEKAVIQ